MNKNNLFFAIGGFIFGSLFWMIVLFIVISVAPVKGQTVTMNPLKQNQFTISASPISMKFFGKTPNTAKLSASMYGFEVIAYYNFKPIYSVHILKTHSYPFQLGHIKSLPYKQGLYMGIFFNPLRINYRRFGFIGGIGWMIGKEFPTKGTGHFRFQAKLQYMLFNRIGLQYSHVSNGFSIFYKYDYGIDNLSLILKF